jgi:hypothetical protein
MLCSIQQISCRLKGYYIWHFAFGAFSSCLAFACGQRLPVEVEGSGPAGAALHEPYMIVPLFAGTFDSMFPSSSMSSIATTEFIENSTTTTCPGAKSSPSITRISSPGSLPAVASVDAAASSLPSSEDAEVAFDSSLPFTSLSLLLSSSVASALLGMFLLPPPLRPLSGSRLTLSLFHRQTLSMFRPLLPRQPLLRS